MELPLYGNSGRLEGGAPSIGLSLLVSARRTIAKALRVPLAMRTSSLAQRRLRAIAIAQQQRPGEQGDEGAIERPHL